MSDLFQNMSDIFFSCSYTSRIPVGTRVAKNIIFFEKSHLVRNKSVILHECQQMNAHSTERIFIH